MAKSGTKILFGFLFFVILVGGLSGGGAWYLTEHRGEGYQASATLLLDAPEDAGGGHPMPPPGKGLDDGLRSRIEATLGIMPTRTASISPPDLAALFTSDHVAATLQEKMATLYTEQGLEPKAWTLEAVRDAMETEVKVALQTRDNVVYQRLVNLRFTAENPALAAAATNAWAEIADAFVASLAVEDLTSLRGTLEAHLGEIRTVLDPAQATLDSLRQGTPVDVLKAAAVDAADAASANKAAVRDLEQQLARDEAARASLKTYVAKAPVAVVLELSVREADLEAELAGTHAERDYLAAQVEPLQAAQVDAQARWADAQKALDAVEETVKHLAPQAAYLERALATMNTPQEQLKLAAPAVAPQQPVGPHRYVIVGGAAVLGAILGMILYFALLTLRVYARELDRS